MKEKSRRTNHGREIIEVKLWWRNKGADIMEERSWKRNAKGKTMKEKYWRRNHRRAIRGGEILKEKP